MRAEAITRINRRTGQPDGIRWKFWIYDSAICRNKVVPVDQIPKHIRESQNQKEVEAYAKSQAALTDARRYRALQRLEWKTKYVDFDVLLSSFTEYHKLRAPNSWETDVFYLGNYTFHFYLHIKQSNNLYEWKYLFEEFRTWLAGVQPLKARKKHLSKNTQNHCIKSLNRFLAWAYSSNKINELQPKCESYSRDSLRKVEVDDLFKPEEVNAIYNLLNQRRPDSASLFRFIVNTGCRINEALGMCPPFIIEGLINGQTSKKIHERLIRYRRGEYFGYIVLMNQPELSSIRLEKDSFHSPVTNKKWQLGNVPRKPLKCRKHDKPEHYRYIPIYDKDTWNDVVERWNKQIEAFDQKRNGDNEQDYLLFDDMTKAVFYSDLAKVLFDLGLKQRGPHAGRHTFLNWFYAEIENDQLLAEKVGGHKDQSSREIYSHLAQQIGLEQQFKSQSKRKLNKVE